MLPNVSFRPTFWPTVLTLPALAVLVALGVWQLQRMDWKEALVEERRARAAGPVIELPTDGRIRVRDLVHRRVAVSGRYMHEAEMHLLNRVRDGVPGMHLVTPLVRADGGPTLLVDRGWVPPDWPGSPLAVNEEVVVEGIVRTESEPGFFVPENRPESNEWYHLDLVQMATSAGVLPFPDFYIFATAEAPAEPGAAAAGDAAAAGRADYPVANEWRVELRNEHLSYAITWFALAGALLTIYVIYHTARRGRRR